MDTETGEASPLFGTWKPALRSEPGISTMVDDDSDGSSVDQQPRVRAYNGYRRTGFATQGQGYNSAYRQRQQPTGNNWRNNQSAPTGRDAYWCNTGPKTETRKLMGYTLDLPVVAPMTAPPEDKKLILSQTKDRLQEAGSGDWNAKTQLLAQRFVVTVPNATNEAKVRLAKFKDWNSDVFSFGFPVGMQTDLNFCELHHTLVLRYLSVEVRFHPRNAPPQETPVPDLPGERCIQALLKLPLTADQTDVHPLCTLAVLSDVTRLMRLSTDMNWDITFGCLSQARTFDTALFDKEYRNIHGECMFHAVAAVLTRDYVGKGITKDIQK